MVGTCSFFSSSKIQWLLLNAKNAYEKKQIMHELAIFFFAIFLQMCQNTLQSVVFTLANVIGEREY